MLTKQDLDLLKQKQISQADIENQLNAFKTGFPFLKIVSAASAQKGIMIISEKDKEKFISAWDKYLSSDKIVSKFVPASGAASRMFKDLYSFLDAEYETPTTEFEKTFFDNIRKFAFFDKLNSACYEMYEKNIDELYTANRYKDVINALLGIKGMEYGNMPKGLLLFHTYDEGNRTPVGEHLSEGVLYAKNSKTNSVKIHFTVSEEHKSLFEVLVGARKSNYEQKLGANFLISYSVQKPSTDTIAVDLQNELFRENDGTLLFRPGGHGALIENLNEIVSDIIFIKNIDNVIPDRLKANEARYKKILGGVLVEMQEFAFNYLRTLESENVSSEDLAEMLSFMENKLCISHSGEFESDKELKSYLKQKLNRPFRVCGMVENVGEPGGGPFIIEDVNGNTSLQILESSQIDKNDKRAVNAFKEGSHFNPVDLVCGVKDYKGNKFDLTKYVDKNTGFISQKSKDGRELKALELPGLWNGAMSDWNTIFVEVPISTFNPVKTVNDLLRPEHQ